MPEHLFRELLKTARVAIVVELGVKLEQCGPSFPIALLERLYNSFYNRVRKHVGQHGLLPNDFRDLVSSEDPRDSMPNPESETLAKQFRRGHVRIPNGTQSYGISPAGAFKATNSQSYCSRQTYRQPVPYIRCNPNLAKIPSLTAGNVICPIVDRVLSMPGCRKNRTMRLLRNVPPRCRSTTRLPCPAHPARGRADGAGSGRMKPSTPPPAN